MGFGTAPAVFVVFMLGGMGVHKLLSPPERSADEAAEATC